MEDSLNFTENSSKNQNSQNFGLKPFDNNVNLRSKQNAESKTMKTRSLEIKIDDKTVKRLNDVSSRTGLSSEEIVRVGLFKILDEFDFTGRIEIESKSSRSKPPVRSFKGVRT